MVPKWWRFAFLVVALFSGFRTVQLSVLVIPAPNAGELKQAQSTKASHHRNALIEDDSDQHEPDHMDDNGLRLGVLSRKNVSFFRHLQRNIDTIPVEERCLRYRSTPCALSNKTTPQQRRLFFGGLIAEEPWELLEIVAAETYGIYEAMLFVEANRTQSFSPRSFKRLHLATRLKELFGAKQVKVIPFINENPHLQGLGREHQQRAQILRGWKDLGMQHNDIGILSDMDETFTRDFLRAAQFCDFVELEYSRHHCRHTHIKIIGQGRIFEASPECVHERRRWLFPGMVVGQCLEEITRIDNKSLPILLDHPKAPRRSTHSFFRKTGWGGEGCKKKEWSEESKITDNRYPLFNAADYRRVCAGGAYPLKADGFALYTAFHFHNFFASLQDTRRKYMTYGHPDKSAGEKNWTQLGNDNILMYNCVKNIADEPQQKWKRVVGGINATLKWWPIYFHDPEYRQERHAYLQRMVDDDSKLIGSS